jgi:hypothetical protein
VKQEAVTSVQEGAMNDRERKHSKIYEQEYQWRNARKLSDIPGTAEIEETIGEPYVPDDPTAPPVTVASFLRQMSCEADAIVIGRMGTKTSQLTEDGKFTFSDYHMHVLEILKNNAAAPIAVNSDIELTRPGGAIRLNGRVIRVTDSSFPHLEANLQYLLFLKFNSETGSYKAFRSGGDYEVVGDRFSPLVVQRLPAELRGGGSKSALTSLLHNSMSNGCNYPERMKTHAQPAYTPDLAAALCCLPFINCCSFAGSAAKRTVAWMPGGGSFQMGPVRHRLLRHY